MITFDISDQDCDAIAEELDDPETDARLRRKLMTIRRHGLGVPHSKIAAALNISNDTVTNYVKLYRDEGLGGLLENRHYRPTSSVEPFLDEIKQSFEETPAAISAEAADRIETISGIRLSNSQARRIMLRIGMKFRKCASVPGKADPQLQFEFMEEELLPRLEEARRGQRRVFFVDAAHFVLGAFLGMIWPFTRVFVPSGSGRQCYNVLGAVETRDHSVSKLLDQSTPIPSENSLRSWTKHTLGRRSLCDGQCPIPIQQESVRGCGGMRDRTAVPSSVLAQPQPDRTCLATGESKVPSQQILRGLREVPGGNRRLHRFAQWRERLSFEDLGYREFSNTRYSEKLMPRSIIPKLVGSLDGMSFWRDFEPDVLKPWVYSECDSNNAGWE